MSTEKHVRGTHIVPLRNFIQSRYDAATRERILSSLSEETRSVLQDLREDAWHPARITNELNTAIFEAQDDPKKGYEELVASGQAIAEHGVNTFMRLLIKLMTPEMLAKKWPAIWAKGHDFGSMEPDLSRVKERYIDLKLFDVDQYAYLGPVGVGFLSFTLKAMGKDEAKVVQQDLDYSRVHAPGYQYQMSW